MRSPGFHQANMVAKNLDTVCYEVLAKAHQVQNVVSDRIAGIPQVAQNIQLPSPQIKTANIVMTNPEMQGIVTLIIHLIKQCSNYNKL